MLKLPRMPEIPEGGAPPDVERVFAEHFTKGGLRPALHPDLPPISSIDCEACDGRGTEHDCQHCCCECETCDGAGVLSADHEVCLAIGQAFFQLKYIRLILSLPGLQIASDPHRTDAMPFTFEGGEGLLMPLRIKYDNRLEITI